MKLSMIKINILEVAVNILKDPFVSDATTYAHHVFKAFDIESTGSINFRVWYKDFILKPIYLH